MNSQFRQFGVAPAVFINVFDPDKAPQPAPGAEIQIINGKATTNDEKAILSTITVAKEDGVPEAMRDTDFTVAAADGGVTIIPLPSGSLAGATSLFVTCKIATPAAITAQDIIGGTDATGQRTGIELVDSVFPKLRLVPGLLAAPGCSRYSGIRQAQGINRCRPWASMSFA